MHLEEAFEGTFELAQPLGCSIQ